MAELTEYEIDWIEGVEKAPIDEDSIDKADAARERRETTLVKYLGPDSELQNHMSEIRRAQEFSVVQTKSLGRKKTIKWRAEDSDLEGAYDVRADVEVDSVHDLVNIEEVELEKQRAINAALARLLSIQTQMLNEFDENGNRLFSDEDIRRELWAPMVRDGTIPENLVPQEFSEQAIAFKGAAEIYQERIDEYSRNSHGKEGLLRGLNIAKETLGLAATIAGGVVTIGNATTSADIKEQLASGKDSDGNVLTSDQKDALKTQQAELQQKEAFTKLGATVLVGGFDIAIGAVEEKAKGEEADWANVADKSITVLMKVVSAGVGPLATAIVGPGDSVTTDSGKQKMVTAKVVQSAVLAALSGIRMVPTLISVYKAKPGDRRNLVDKLINQIADGVQFGMTAAADRESDKEKQANMKAIAALVRTGIIGVCNVEKAIECLANGKPGEAALLLGGAAFQGGAAALSNLCTDFAKQEVTQQEYESASTAQRQYMVVTSDTADPSRDEGLRQTAEIKKAEAMQAFQQTVSSQLTTATAAANQLVDNDDPLVIDPDEAAFAEGIQQQIADEQQRQAEEELTKQFSDPEFVKEMFDDFETKMVGYEELYAEATPDSMMAGKPADEVARGLEAIDKAIAQTAALRARAEMINALTSGAAGLVASFVPGTGAVVAAQAVAFDIYCLVRAVEMHNKWVASMEVALSAYSAYSPAIEKTLKNATITLSHKGVKLALDSLKLGNEVARCFDPTGVTTIVSAGLTMTAALVEYGYKMQKEVEITMGWKAYKKARKNPADRKNTRKALRMNSTLAKCCIAYGACMDNDPAAQEAIKNCGLTPAVLADDKDVCKRLVAFLENEMNEDPVVMHVEKQPKKWQPGRPELTSKSWFETKSAAAISATPRLDQRSVSTPGMDRMLADLASADYWEGHKSYNEWRQDKAKDASQSQARHERATKTIDLLEKMVSQMESYRPLNAGAVTEHEEMADIAETYKNLALLNIRVAKTDILPT